MSRVSDLERELWLPAEDGVFSEELVADQPDAVRRFFLHAIAPGTRLARSVRLRQSATMRPRPGAARLDLTATETLSPPSGLLWRAKTRIGPVPFNIVDSHFNGMGRIRGTVLGIPVMRAGGADVSRSSRHRVVAESLWVPSVLLPRRGVRWTEETDEWIRAEYPIDNEIVQFRIRLRPDGSVRELAMERFGNVGTPTWEPIPYGFSVEAEGTFNGYTIGTEMRGGWWRATDRYDPEGASYFHIERATYG